MYSLILNSKGYFESRTPLACATMTKIHLKIHLLYDEDTGFLNQLLVATY